jgi:hypothetical protein
MDKSKWLDKSPDLRIMYTSKMYLHPDCFSCMQNYFCTLLELPKINTDVCNRCSHKFECMTSPEYQDTIMRGVKIKMNSFGSWSLR